MKNVKYSNCYWYHEYQDMSASVPTCDYYRQYGKCQCEPECEHFITKKEVDDIVRNMGKIGQMSDLISRQDALKPFCVTPDGIRIPEVDCDNFPVEFSVEFIKKHLLSLPSAEPRGNLISREDAIEALDKEYRYTDKSDDWDGLETAIKIIKALSPADAENRLYVKIYADDEPFVKAEKLYQICGETQNKEVTEWLKEYFPLSDDNWIPVSEKLPDEDDYNEYLVIDDRGYMAVGNYRHDAKAWDSGNFGWLEIRDKADEFPWGIGKVIAWYKPKPYKESEVEE